MHAFDACKYRSALVLALSLTSLAATAHAAMIGINFVGANNGGGISIGSATAGAAAQANWNDETSGTGTSSSILLSDGTSSGSSLAWSSNDAWATGHAGLNANGDLLQGYLDDLSTRTTTVTLSTLPNSIAGTGSTPYNVYIYIAGDTAGRGGTYTVNGQTAVLVNSGPEADGTLIAATPGTDSSGTGAIAGNYYEFTNITGTSLSISTTPTIGGANERTPIDGIQVVTAPEPATLSALSLLALPLLARRRRRA